MADNDGRSGAGRQVRRLIRPHARCGAPQRLLVLAACALALLLGTRPGAAAQEGEEMRRQRDALRWGETDARRESAAWLGRNGTAETVPALVDALRDPDPGVRLISENAIWRIWMRSGDASIDHELQVGAEYLQEQRFQEALDVFEEVVRKAPDFAEGYNKRATALYYLGRYERSLNDIQETLQRNRFHFGALSGAGLCMIALREPELALQYFQRALAINPNLAGVQEMMERLRRIAREKMM